MPTKIEWTDETWNPVTGCTKVSEGCKNCYAEKIGQRFTRIGVYARTNLPLYDTNDFSDVLLHPDRLDQPLHWRKPRRIFVCSMGDLFHEDVPTTFIVKGMVTISHSKQHTYLLLTKRPKRMADFFEDIGAPANCWLGVTAENQATADERIPILLQIPAAVRFVSVEPMLSDIDFSGLPESGAELDWVICGCESGQNRRPCKSEWARNLKDQCVGAGVPFFLKQLPAWKHIPGFDKGEVIKMPFLDGRQWDQYPEAK